MRQAYDFMDCEIDDKNIPKATQSDILRKPLDTFEIP